MKSRYLFNICKWTISNKSPITAKSSKRDGIGKMLLVVRMNDETTLTIRQHINAIVDYSQFSVDVINISKAFPFLSKKERSKYDVIALHNTVTIPEGIWLKLLGILLFKSYTGKKVVIKQDEHEKTNRVVAFLKKYNVNLLLSIWDEETAKTVYQNECPRLHIMANCLTGYVPKEYRQKNYSLDNRQIDVGYRGIPFLPFLGRLGYEKEHIGDMFSEKIDDDTIILDVSSKYEDRIYGEKWLDFLASCKFQLGVESGTDIVDMDGSVQRKTQKIMNESLTDEEKLLRLDNLAGDLHYRAISPRLFEAIACKSVQILLEGDYQGILVPYRHYLPLKRDFSNIKEIVGYIHDDEKRKEIANCAFNEILFDDEYSYEKFVERLDYNIMMVERCD